MKWWNRASRWGRQDLRLQRHPAGNIACARPGWPSSGPASPRTDPDELCGLLRRHAPEVDLIVTTGGVSKGAYEVVRQAMDGQDVAFRPRGHAARRPAGDRNVRRRAPPGVPGEPGQLPRLLRDVPPAGPERACWARPHRGPRSAARLARAAHVAGGQAPGPARHPAAGRHRPAGRRRQLAPGPCPGAAPTPWSRCRKECPRSPQGAEVEVWML